MSLTTYDWLHLPEGQGRPATERAGNTGSIVSAGFAMGLVAMTLILTVLYLR